jgi:predicted transcriptional regulator
MQAGRDMETLKTRARAQTRRLAKRLARATGVDTELRRLLNRVDELEREVQETRRLHQRLAELTDVVTEVLVPAADRDDDKIRTVLAKYNQTSF